MFEIHDYCYFNRQDAAKYADGKDFVKEKIVVFDENDVDSHNSIYAPLVTFYNSIEEAILEINS